MLKNVRIPTQAQKENRNTKDTANRDAMKQRVASDQDNKEHKQKRSKNNTKGRNAKGPPLQHGEFGVTS